MKSQKTIFKTFIKEVSQQKSLDSSTLNKFDKQNSDDSNSKVKLGIDKTSKNKIIASSRSERPMISKISTKKTSKNANEKTKIKEKVRKQSNKKASKVESSS